jgi:heme/copper-type cytochrome/quinol oxidase subunit 1
MNDLLWNLASGLIELFSNIVNMAPLTGMVLFVIGGIGGIVLNMKSKEKH